MYVLGKLTVGFFYNFLICPTEKYIKKYFNKDNTAV